MAYIKNNWVDRKGTTRYFKTIEDDGAEIFTPDYSKVTELGTPVNADNMNHIEEGVEGCAIRKHTLTEVFETMEWVVAVVDGEKKIFQSKQDNNQGHAVTETDWWEEVAIGGGGTSLPLFTPVIQDHILSFEESKGYALQGTYVYKTGVAGSRYGYPDFYTKCLEEKNAGTPTQTTLGSSTITTYNNANGHIFYDIADKAVIDEWYNTYGIAWYYGIDEENERIFLPRNIHYSESLMMDDYSEILYTSKKPRSNGTLYTAECDGLLLGNDRHAASGSKQDCYVYVNGFNVRCSNVRTDYMVNSWAYPVCKGDTYRFENVETAYFVPCKGGEYELNLPDTLKDIPTRYIYMVVGNTEQQSAVTDVVDITTSENDTIPLFKGTYFDFKPNHPSWLKAGEQANNAGIYTSAYNTLVNCLTGDNPYNLKVIEVSAMVLGTDYSEYWKVDQDTMTFTTPTKISYMPINADTAPVVGTGMTLGLQSKQASATNAPTVNYGLMQGVLNDPYLSPHTAPYGQPIKTQFNSTTQGSTIMPGASVGVTTDPTKSGMVADLAGAKSTTSQLYFKVANAVQNLELLNAGEVLEALATKTDMAQAAHAAMPSNRYIDLTLGAAGSTYEVPSDGWLTVYFRQTATNGYCFMTNHANGINSFYQPSNVTNFIGAAFLPVSKGDAIYVDYGNISVNYFRFIYAEGAK